MGSGDRLPLEQGRCGIRGADAGALTITSCVTQRGLPQTAPTVGDVLKRLFASLFLFAALVTARPLVAEDALTVFAAASVKDAMDRAAAAFETETGVATVVSFASSSVLARQIEAGAPPDIFISANKAWMGWLEERELIRGDDRRNIAANDLVIAARVEGEAREEAPDDLLAKGRFAMGDPSHVPAGIYAKQALESLDLWKEVSGNAVFGENVRVALELAARGEVAAAIVYGSDQKLVEGELARVYTFPAGSYDPIVYPAAPTVDASPMAAAFLDFLSGPAGQEIFAKLGFSSPPGEKQR